jgi:hypothetical protein
MIICKKGFYIQLIFLSGMRPSYFYYCLVFIIVWLIFQGIIRKELIGTVFFFW